MGSNFFPSKVCHKANYIVAIVWVSYSTGLSFVFKNPYGQSIITALLTQNLLLLWGEKESIICIFLDLSCRWCILQWIVKTFSFSKSQPDDDEETGPLNNNRATIYKSARGFAIRLAFQPPLLCSFFPFLRATICLSFSYSVHFFFFYFAARNSAPVPKVQLRLVENFVGVTGDLSLANTWHRQKTNEIFFLF